MKKVFLIGLAALGFLMACSSSSEKKSEKDAKFADMTDTTETFIYKANDGTDMGVSYVYAGSKGTAHIQIQDKKYELNQVKADANGAEFQNETMKLITKGDSVLFGDLTKQELLTLINPVFENYSNGKEELLVIYHNGTLTADTPSYAILQKQDGTELKLAKGEASAKGAVYSDGKVTWDAEGGTHKLTENGKSTTFKVVPREEKTRLNH